MIKNFKQRIDSRGYCSIPVWGATGQEYRVTGVSETASDGYWRGTVHTKWVVSQYMVPEKIDVDIKSFDKQMEWNVEVSFTDEQGRNRQALKVMVVPEHFKTPDTFGKLIADIIDNPEIDYFN